MAQSLSKIIVHIIFSTKNREPTISESIDKKLYAYMAGILKQWGSKAISIGGATDHVHVLCVLSKNHAPSKIIEEVKKGSSKWMKSNGGKLSRFQWQNGYGMFSVSQSNVRTAKQYIVRQAEHHRRITFQEEFRRFLKKYEVEFDERYVWD